MARKLPPIQLSKLIGGVHSQEAEARGEVKLSPDRCLSALNVIEEDGYLVRRPAFKPIVHGPHYTFPAGQVVVSDSLSNTVNYHRTFSIAGGSIVAGTYLYIGCDSQFNGIEFPDMQVTTTGFTSHGYLKVEFQDTLHGWTEIQDLVDLTRGRCVNGTDIWVHTLTQKGTVAWALPSITWDQTTVESVSKYWVRLSIVDGSGTAINFGSAATWVVFQPGVLCFKLEPVNSILPARYRNGRSALFIGGDRTANSGLEAGANISAWTQTGTTPKVGFKVISGLGEGAALWYGHPTAIFIRRGAAAAGTRRVWPTDFTNTAAPTNPEWEGWLTDGSGGTSPVNRLIKINRAYNWLSAQSAAPSSPESPNCEYRGGLIRYGISPTSVTSNSSTTKRCTMVFSSSDLNADTDELAHCFLRIRTVGGTAISIQEEVQIISNTSTTIITYPEFSATPNTSCTFHIYTPHNKVQYAESSVSDFIWYNFPHYLQFNPAGAVWPFNFEQQNDGWYHFYVGKEMRWEYPRGEFWSAVYDPVSAKHILTNGRGPLLEWDGKYFRELAANTDPNTVAVQQYTTTLGAFDDVVEANQATDRFVIGALHKVPPVGKYMASFGSKLVVARDRVVQWSVAYDTNIWPRRFEQEIRDPYSNNITGLEVLGDRIVAFTPTSVFSSPYADDRGMLNFQIESTGIGFTSGRAVSKIYINGSPALIGPTADGVRIYAPGSANLVPVIDDWQQVLPEGVNLGLLSKCIGASSKADLRYYLAVPRAGQTRLDTILVFDLSVKSWWVWRYPGYGVTSIVRDSDENGNEQILFGGIDGMVSVLTDSVYDYGTGLTPVTVPWHATSPVVAFRGSTVAPTAMLITGEEASTDMTVTTYLNSRLVADDTSTVALDEGSAEYGTGTYGTSTYAEGGVLVAKVNMPTGTRCNSFQFKLSGLGRFKYKGGELLVTDKGQRSKQ
jgi:hypothetical protein